MPEAQREYLLLGTCASSRRQSEKSPPEVRNSLRWDPHCHPGQCPTPVPPSGCDEGTCTAHVRRKHGSIRTSQWISVCPTRSLPNQSPCARTHSISLSCRYLHGHEQHVDDHALPLHMEGRSVFRIVRAHMPAVPSLDTVCKSVAPAMTILMPSLIRGPRSQQCADLVDITRARNWFRVTKEHICTLSCTCNNTKAW